jgi:hypothetical protein
MTDSQQDSGDYRAPGGPGSDQPTGGHPIKAVIGGIVALWLILWLVIPNPKDQPVDPRTGKTERTPGMTSGTSNVPHVTSRTVAVLPEFNAAAVLVPPDTTNEQIANLLQRFKTARVDETLVQYVPATSKGDRLGPHAIADIYVFSESEWATVAALRALAEGPHNRDGKPGALSFRDVVQHVRGHYAINLHEAEHRDRASLGYADEEGSTYSTEYKELF